jgi:iron-sulfur cluster repair protein YtfE (RIC family)
MPIPLHILKAGKPPDLVESLLECHERIRHFTAVAAKIGAARGVADESIRSAAADVQRYFRHGLPHHVEDEEKSIVPRLTGRSRDVDEALATMEREHVEHGPPLERLLALMDRLVAAPSEQPRVAADVTAAAAELTRAFDSHLASEEQRIFPALRSLLTAAEQQQILGELRARRATTPPGVRST